jgi:hypothetical protein
MIACFLGFKKKVVILFNPVNVYSFPSKVDLYFTIFLRIQSEGEPQVLSANRGWAAARRSNQGQNQTRLETKGNNFFFLFEVGSCYKNSIAFSEPRFVYNLLHLVLYYFLCCRKVLADLVHFNRIWFGPLQKLDLNQYHYSTYEGIESDQKLCTILRVISG